jgi:hypothetical protein
MKNYLKKNSGVCGRAIKTTEIDELDVPGI